MIKDEYTNYNYMFHRYYLTQEGLQTLGGIDLTDKILNISIDTWLQKVSDTLYDWVSANRSYFSYMVATNEEAHNTFLKALCYQAEWCLNNGFVDEEAAINWDSTTKMDESLYDRTVSPRVYKLLLHSGLLYCGRLPEIPYSEYEDEPVKVDSVESMFDEE